MDREQMASELSEALRRKIVFENVSIDEHAKSLEAMGLPGYTQVLGGDQITLQPAV
jgi:NAD(P)H dehydrogenase (quinone)